MTGISRMKKIRRHIITVTTQNGRSRYFVGGENMRQHHCIFPYEQDTKRARELLMAKPFTTFMPGRITLFCTKLSGGCVQDALVSRGQCVGFMEACPVYASLEGRIERIEKQRFKYDLDSFAVHIVRENHHACTWSEIVYDPECTGSTLLRQMGLNYHEKNVSNRANTVLWIDGVDSNPGDISGYRLMLEETIKIILGAGLLAKAFRVKKVVFCIENTWSEIEYVLEKYMTKYKLLSGAEMAFCIKKYERCYPMHYDVYEQYVFKPLVAVHAYNAYYEHFGVTDTWMSVSGAISRCGNFKVPAGTHVSDLLLYCGYDCKNDLKVVENSLLSGRRVSEAESVITPWTRSLIVRKIETYPVRSCTGCGACVRVCPMHLIPNAMTPHMMEVCMHCGCCSYVCPANQRLSEFARRKVGVNPKVQIVPFQTQVNRSAYIELAPKLASALGSLTCPSDAPPHIHAPKKSILKSWL